MDYVVGSVAALVSGNVTPNRPKFSKKALTPIKHQPSPNVTPKSELVDDRSIFLSPTLQKKKAIVKKSPKRIFQNPDLDATNDGEDNPKSPKADKVKKHLKEELEADVNLLSPKSPKIKNSKAKELPLRTNLGKENEEGAVLENSQVQNENTPKKKKKKQTSVSEETTEANIDVSNDQVNDLNGKNDSQVVNVPLSSKKKNTKNNLSPKKILNQLDQSSDSTKNEKQSSLSLNKKNKLEVTQEDTSKAEMEDNQDSNMNISKPKGKNKKQKSQCVLNNINNSDNIENEYTNDDLEVKQAKKKNRKRKNKNEGNKMESEETKEDQGNEEREVDSNVNVSKKKKKKSSTFVNPNAITDKDTDSEHDSDNEIESENEQTNKEALDTGPVEESSDEEEKVPKKQEKLQKNKEVTVNTEEEVKRTLFVGNVPFSAKCKKEIKKIFSKYGQIETVRIRTVPVKDGRVTPKLAVIKNELHPDRSTVNVYVKFRDESSVNEALAENGTVLNDHHLRVTRSDCTGSEHDPKCSVFVGNIPFALEDEALQQTFQQCGEIVSVRIIRDRKTNAGKGFGYVNFKSKDAVELALALSEEDLTIKNRILRVKRCTQITHKQKPQQDNRRGNLHGNYNRGNVQSRNQFGNRGDNRNVGRPNNNDSKADGAYRRLMNKRKNQDGGEGPPNKMQRSINQPGKKTRKEFVGMTAEKKKKHKLNKGQKKKKALSEILTKL
ncbi:unnamed protein product [Parnassius mnemosyne]|uniref:RRM domain-containing protein n=1 Tax=Parnassius mnemosyne TaxID=213953 RepID=A0AAV1LI31_9NEOP